VIATISSGRNVPSIIEYAHQIGLDGPLIGMQGAIAREIPAKGEAGSGRMIRHFPFPAHLGAKAVEWCRENNLWGHAVIRDDLRFDVRDPHVRQYETWLQGDALKRLGTVPDLISHLTERKLHLSKVVAHAPEGHVDGVLNRARATFAGELDVTISHPEYLEFTAPGVNKGTALRWLARRLKIPLGQVMAIGDQYNDLEMLDVAGHGVAMAGAPGPVRAVAQYEAPRCEDDGAARMIERLILGSAGE
jgi:Cof subfamily protein (haloacid dehalogenase superfamily)